MCFDPSCSRLEKSAAWHHVYLSGKTMLSCPIIFKKEEGIFVASAQVIIKHEMLSRTMLCISSMRAQMHLSLLLIVVAVKSLQVNSREKVLSRPSKSKERKREEDESRLQDKKGKFFCL